jgi:hypothetical protein
MRHIADMQVQNDLAALRLLAPERDAFGKPGSGVPSIVR